MKIEELIDLIKQDENCEVIPAKNKIALPTNIPDDLKKFYELTDGIKLFESEPYGIKIVGREEFIPTNKYLYPKDDVIWEELEGEVCNEWYLIAKVDEMSQYISIDLTSERNGQCYDSFYETHSLQGDSAIVAKNFTELLTKLNHNKGQHWYWLQDDFEKLGDAYDEPII
ncbi:SMI1/KNR4 family protein [Elizabethkingia anophelis]|uniref:SMI1/KNR4 family protein n=1 Tax=Elizabethkingia anophelis TaxID=1117645 RepID=UPI00301BAF53